MKARILSVAIEQETDIILVRQRTRAIAAALGFDAQDQTRITTAVSEIVRNTLEYGGGGRIEYGIDGSAPEQALTIFVEDQGRGIADPRAILEGRHRSATGMGVGIVGARRLMDHFTLDSAPGKGTRVGMAKVLPRRVQPILPPELKRITAALSTQELADPMAEVRRQNREMLTQLDELTQRQGELNDLNRELQDTNRGVVALYAELEERADHLRRADQLKSRFLSNMSHEFRTPLNSILSLSRLLLSRTDGTLAPEQEKQVQFIRKSAENLMELVNDLLDLAKVEAGKTVVNPREFIAEDLFSALRGMLRPLLVGDNVLLIFDDATDIPLMNTDEAKISQILRNFISNALKFTEHGEVRVWAQYDRDTDAVTFKVRDSGIGIAEEDIERIWEEFSQVSGPIQSRVKGTGLGLPLSRRLAELLRGAVSVDSALGQGSVFELTVPRHYNPPPEAEVEGRWVIDPQRLPVLCVENNPADAFSMERALARSRYQVLPARSLAEAESALLQFAPAAVLLDVLLDGEESWRLLIKLRQSERWGRLPVIIISTTDEEAKARGFGGDGFFSKPVDPPALVRALDELTGVNSVTRVLVIDDEEVSRYLVRQLLPRGAFDIREAATAIDGLERLRQDTPDVILLDLNMKPMDGFEFLERLGPTPKAPPAIVITSMDVNDRLRERLPRASRVVSKFDLTTDTLVAAILAAVGGNGATPS